MVTINHGFTYLWIFRHTGPPVRATPKYLKYRGKLKRATFLLNGCSRFISDSLHPPPPSPCMPGTSPENFKLIGWVVLEIFIPPYQKQSNLRKRELKNNLHNKHVNTVDKNTYRNLVPPPPPLIVVMVNKVPPWNILWKLISAHGGKQVVGGCGSGVNTTTLAYFVIPIGERKIRA